MANKGLGCGDRSTVYTRVSAFYEWIRDNEDALTTTPTSTTTSTTTSTSTTTATSTTPSMSSIQIECFFSAFLLP